MTDLSRIQELKELSNIDEVNSLLKQGWVLLSISKHDERNFYVIGFDDWKKFSIDNPIEENEFMKGLMNKEN
ncbi:MAG: hypothetical protein WB445_04970 [Acinetobacter sp.]